MAFVERERELIFEHPVAVNFLSEVEFLALFQQPDEVLDEQAFADEADMYGSLGLANDYDPSTDPATMEEVLILGFYDPESDQVFVRGSDLTPESEGGNATVDEAMRLPPTPEQLLDPLQYLNPPATAVTMSQPPVQSSTPPGADSIYLSSPFGLFEAMVMLDAWLPWYQTRRALDGWDDAAISVFRTNGVVCSAITIRVDDRASAGRLAEALRDWSEATSSSVRPTISEGARGHPEVSFTPCADVSRDTPPAPAITPSYAVGFETSFVQDVLAADDGISPNVARCVARQLVDDETFLDLIDVYEWTPEQDDLYDQTVETLRTRCARFP